MDKKIQKPIINYLESNKNQAVKFFVKEKKMEYNSKIKQHREIKKISGDEDLVRMYLISRLTDKLGYKPENIEFEKEYPSGRPKTTKPRIDVILKDKNKKDIFLFVELKETSEFEKNQDETIEMQLFNLAKQEDRKIKYLVLYSVEVINNEIKDKCIIIDFEKFKSFDEWKEIRDFSDELPARYGKAQKEPYIKGKKDLETNFTHEKLDGLRKNLHNVLWGGGGTDDNDVFASLVNIILAKIQDEDEKEKGEKYDFQVFSYADKKENAIFETNQELFDRINTLYRKALKDKLNITDKQELQDSFVVDRKKFSLAKLKYTVSELEKFSFVDGKNSFDGKDILGDFFEGIIREGFKQSKGQFFTHINIVKFMLWGLQLDKFALERVNRDLEIPYLIDPSAGSGTFLIEYMKFITKSLKYRFKNKLATKRSVEDKFQEWFMPNHRENKWAQHFIYGVETNFNLGTATKVNMILHGDGSTNIFVKDGLLPFKFYDKETAPNFLKQYEEDKRYFDKEVNGQFDVIITNPPFSVTLDNETKKYLAKEFVFGDKKNSENLFIERWYQLLKPNGRFGVVLPESVFDTTENKYIRLFIYKYFNVKAVVSLPQIAFEPFTSTKTSLLFAQKKTKAEIEQWNKLWSKYAEKYSQLRTSIQDYIKYFVDCEKLNEKWADYVKDEIKNKKVQIIKEKILYFLKDYCEKEDKKLEIKNLLKKYKDEIEELSKFDKDLLGTLVSDYRENTWWVFGEVAKELNYKIFMAEVENVGYKRTKRGEKPMPNELYRVDKNGEVLVDDGVMKTALDYMRDIEWE